MAELVNTVLNAMSTLNKPQRLFMAALFSTLMCFQGKATFRNMSRYSDMCEKRFSRWYQRKFPYSEFNSKLLLHSFPEPLEHIAAIDASFMKKSGKKTDGLGWFYNGAQATAERGLEISLISAVNIKANTAYSIDARQTLDEDNKSRIDLYAEHVKDIAPKLKSLGIKYLAADALYSKAKFISAVTDTGLHLIGKLRVDANLKWLHNGNYSGNGRPKKFDGKIYFGKDLSRFDHVKTLNDKSEIYTAIVHSVLLKKNVRVVVLISSNSNITTRAILFSTDTELNALTILSYYKARFQIEFLFRDAKQYTGLTHCQSRRKQAIEHQVNASLTSLNLLKIEDRNRKKSDEATVISIASWKRRKSNQNLMSKVFHKLGLSLKSDKVANVYRDMSDYGAIAS